MKKPYTVQAIDNLGTLGDATPRDRTWAVVDRRTGEQVGERDTRAAARKDCQRLNACEAHREQRSEEHSAETGR